MTTHQGAQWVAATLDFMTQIEPAARVIAFTVGLGFYSASKRFLAVSFQTSPRRLT